MKPLALDTPLHVKQRWIAGLRARGAGFYGCKLMALSWPTFGTGL